MTRSDNPGAYYLAFENWYFEIEAFSLRAERLTSPIDELRAAFEAGRSGCEVPNVCHKCGVILGVSLQVCNDCMTRLNRLDG